MKEKALQWKDIALCNVRKRKCVFSASLRRKHPSLQPQLIHLISRAAHCLMVRKGIDKRKEDDLVKGKMDNGQNSLCPTFILLFNILVEKSSS